MLLIFVEPSNWNYCVLLPIWLWIEYGIYHICCSGSGPQPFFQCILTQMYQFTSKFHERSVNGNLHKFQAGWEMFTGLHARFGVEEVSDFYNEALAHWRLLVCNPQKSNGFAQLCPIYSIEVGIKLNKVKLNFQNSCRAHILATPRVLASFKRTLGFKGAPNHQIRFHAS